MNPKIILKNLIALSLLALGLSGCATALPPSGPIARLPVTRAPGEGANVTSAAIQLISGQLYAKGGVELTDWRPGNSRIHVDVRLLDGAGKELALKSNSVPVHARTSRAGLISPFWVLLEPWPESTAQVTATAHLGQHSPVSVAK